MEEINKQRLHVNACMETIRQGMQVVQQAAGSKSKSPEHERTYTALEEIFRQSVNKTFEQIEILREMWGEHR